MKRRKDVFVLFDIDGTLLSVAPAGRIALEMATKEILQSKAGLEGISLEGNTDLNIIRQICNRESIEFPKNDRLKKLIERYAEFLRSEIQGKGHLKPGVKTLLNELASSTNVGLGLVTGNFKIGAEIKLNRFGIKQFFSVGAYGCENHDRKHLVGLALERAVQAKGTKYEPAQVTLIGDTIHDIASCIPWGIKSLGVATGSTSMQALSQAGANFSMENLENLDEVLSFIFN